MSNDELSFFEEIEIVGLLLGSEEEYILPPALFRRYLAAIETERRYVSSSPSQGCYHFFLNGHRIRCANVEHP